MVTKIVSQLYDSIKSHSIHLFYSIATNSTFDVNASVAMLFQLLHIKLLGNLIS